MTGDNFDLNRVLPPPENLDQDYGNGNVSHDGIAREVAPYNDGTFAVGISARDNPCRTIDIIAEAAHAGMLSPGRVRLISETPDGSRRDYYIDPSRGLMVAVDVHKAADGRVVREDTVWADRVSTDSLRRVTLGESMQVVGFGGILNYDGVVRGGQTRPTSPITAVLIDASYTAGYASKGYGSGSAEVSNVAQMLPPGTAKWVEDSKKHPNPLRAKSDMLSTADKELRARGK
jgi:hypothetical protein